MGPTWVLSAPDGPHVGPMNLAIRDCINFLDACTHSMGSPAVNCQPQEPATCMPGAGVRYAKVNRWLSTRLQKLQCVSDVIEIIFGQTCRVDQSVVINTLPFRYKVVNMGTVVRHIVWFILPCIRMPYRSVQYNDMRDSGLQFLMYLYWTAFHVVLWPFLRNRIRNRKPLYGHHVTITHVIK